MLVALGALQRCSGFHQPGTSCVGFLHLLLKYFRRRGAGGKTCYVSIEYYLTRTAPAFILYRQSHQAEVTARHPGLSNPDISKIIGEQWTRYESVEVKERWQKLAEEEKLQHKKQYPDYRYQPRRGGRNANGKHPSSATDDGRCPKCGGRFIAAPRTPSSPLRPAQEQAGPASCAPSSAEDALNRRPSQVGPVVTTGVSQYLILNGDGHREMHESYEPLSPSPDRKKRRISNIGAYQQTQNSTAQPNHAVSHPGAHAPSSAPPVHQAYGQRQLPAPRAMAPPPRPSPNWPNPYGPTTRRPAFDNLLHLAPLQTPITPSPSSADTSIKYPSPINTATSAGAGWQAQEAEDRVMTIPYLDRLMMLCEISPPLPAFCPGNVKTEARGALIAIEGPHPELLKVVGAAVEKALSDSDDVALKTWGADDLAPLADRPDARIANTPAAKPHVEVSRCYGSYLGRMGQWYERSKEIIQHMTTTPRPMSGGTIMCAQRTLSEASVPAGMNPMAAMEPDMPAHEARVPVALVPTGFSLTLTDKFACATPVVDSYPRPDHWGWMARFWQGIVGPDLFIYVKPSSEEEINTCGGVKFKCDGIMVVRVEEGKGLDEKLQRRLAFEVLEWVRAGTYKTWPREGARDTGIRF